MLSPAIKAKVKNNLSDSQIMTAKRTFYSVYSLFCRRSLTKLAIAFGTDKEGSHFYSKHYQHHFEPYRQKKLNVLEIGVGGYKHPKRGGESLRLWKAYFPKSKIYGIDIYDKSFHNEDRIKTFVGSQVDEEFLKRVVSEIGTIDIVIDDGSHLNEHVIKTFKILFPLLSPRGLYAIEDLQTSYWDEVKGEKWGGSPDLTAPHTSMNFLKSLIDGLNFEEFPVDTYKPSYFDRHIVGMHFYHNLAFIYKGVNNEGSNILGKRFQ
jgi:demethylmacrocin O-methyltransferase